MSEKTKDIQFHWGPFYPDMLDACPWIKPDGNQQFYQDGQKPRKEKDEDYD
jgi:hypothetical protein